MPSKDTQFGRSHGKPDKPITSRGLPRIGTTVPGAPERTMKPGTPGWIKAAARQAEGKTSFTRQVGAPDCNHRVRGGWAAGNQDRGPGPKLQDPDRKVRETRA